MMSDLDDAHAAESLRRYLVNQVATASPAQRLVMLLDQLRRDLHCAQLAFAAKDLKEISDNLVHAQHILNALRDPLDRTTELGQALSGVYGFCVQTLIEINLKKNPKQLPDVLGIIDRITEANRAALAAMSQVDSVNA
jgi:flagellar protein FliS